MIYYVVLMANDSGCICLYEQYDYQMFTCSPGDPGGPSCPAEP